MTFRSTRTRLTVLVALIGAFAVTGAAYAEKKVVRFKFDGPIAEAPSPEMGFAALFGGDKARTLLDWTQLIDKAAKDKDVAGAIIIVDSPSFSLAQLEEINRSLNAFQAAGKKIHCYLDSGSNLTYALASTADHITLTKYSDLMIAGLHGEASYYKNMFDKIGVEADMLHCGAYKSAMEPYVRTEPSKEAKENVDWLLDGLFDKWVGLIAEGRKLKPEQVKAAIDIGWISADKALELKLVDAVGSWSDFRQMIQKEYGKDVKVVRNYGHKKGVEIEPGDFYGMMQQIQELFSPKEEAGKPGIAIIYVDGPIMMGRSEPSPFGGAPAGSTTVRAALEKALADENVKAVVLRVDSPGGSAVASDIMYVAAMQLKKAKPVIVSMGSVAGSGGYYVALPGDVVFAEESTITGSIGVVGGKLTWKKLWEEKIGINTTEYNRGKRAGMFSMNAKWSDEDRSFMTNYLNEVYTQFKGRVTESRGEKIKGDLEALAGGRVYTGKQALEKGLIDKLGGLNDAMALARSKANLPADSQVYILPKPPEFADLIKQMMGEETDDEFAISASDLGFGRAAMGDDPLLSAALPLLNKLAPEKFRQVMLDLQNLSMLNRERVGMFMPTGLNPR